jgi:hypothetical protein
MHGYLARQKKVSIFEFTRLQNMLNVCPVIFPQAFLYRTHFQLLFFQVHRSMLQQAIQAFQSVNFDGADLIISL